MIWHTWGRFTFWVIGRIVLILLPPSEGKAAAGDGPPLDLAALSLPSLAEPRGQVLDALQALCAGPEEIARQVLGLSPGQAAAVALDRGLREAPTLRTADLYTGVLYDQFGLATLDAAARRRAADRILIFSGLWGALRLDDRVPPYRLSMGVRLPPLGGLAAFWRPALTRALAPVAADGLIVDMRSTPYAAVWRPIVQVADRPDRQRIAAIRVVRERFVGGAARRTVVSHMAKATRGAVTRALVRSEAEPRTVQELAKTLLDAGHAVETTESGLDIVIND